MANLDLIDSFNNCHENGSAIENQVPLVRQVLEPLVENDIPFPSCIERAIIGTTKSTQFGVAVLAAQTQNLCQPPVKVRANLHIRVSQATLVGFEMVCQGQCYCVPGAFKHIDEQFTVARDTRPEASVKSLELRHKMQ
jgi:hypothetical protein